jgi:hypothetical protein
VHSSTTTSSIAVDQSNTGQATLGYTVCLKEGTRYPGTSWPPQEKVFIWPPFFQYQYNKRLLRQKMGGTCLYMPQDGHWLASFEVIPPAKKGCFPAAKKMKIPH